MYFKIIILNIITIFCVLVCKGQDGISIAGTVLDAQTGLPVQGAYISTTNRSANAISNGSGLFSITVPLENSTTDSLVIDALGYQRMILPFSALTGKPIKLLPITYILPEVSVTSYQVDWNDFMKKMGSAIKEAKIPFESEIEKTITISINLNPSRNYSVKGLSHSEGLVEEIFTSYLRGLTFWYTATNVTIKDSTPFTGCNESGKPEIFTEFENGKFQWLYKIHASEGEAIAEYKIETITLFGGDSVYVVKYIPKQDADSKIVRRLNSTSDNGIFSFFSIEKTLFVRKKDFRLLRIDFIQTPENVTPGMKKYIKSINEISGTVGFQYFNNTPHPAYIYEKYRYQDIDGNEVERNDSTFYSNIKMIFLSNDELKKKYQIKYIYRSFPIRSAQLNYQEKVGPFWYVPMLK